MEKKFLKIAVLTLAILIAGSSTLWAEETAKKPLDEVFDQTVILPFDYHNKIFLNGEKANIFGDYKLFQKNGRVLVPIRLMSTLATENDRYNGCWEVLWDPAKPDDVVMTNNKLAKTVKLKANSKTMYINNVPQTLDVPPQIIEGRIVLPLRSTSEALDKKIAWLDGLIIISNDFIDMQNTKTLEIKDKIKTKLVDPRKVPDYEKIVIPVGKYGDTIYYVKFKHNADRTRIIEELYKKTGSQPEVKIPLLGQKRFNNCKVIDNQLYYVTVVNGKSELDIFSFADNKARKLCSLGDWDWQDGWLGDMRYINNDFYIVLHSGDCTMGSEDVFKLENGRLKEITGAKSFIEFDTAEGYFYYTDFIFMTNTADNLIRVNMQTGEKENLGEKDFTYGVSRTIEDGGGTSYSGNGALYIKDGYIYTIGYKETDQKDKSPVYKISLSNKTQDKLTLPVREFWLVDNKIYYIDLSTGYLVRVDLEGNNKKTLVERKVVNVQFFNGNIYYNAGKNISANTRFGKLYKYNIASSQEIMLSNKSISEFFVGNAGVYYKAEGYDLGLYKIDATGRSLCLVDDSIYSALLTDSGMVYTLDYQEGIYTAK